MLKALLIGGASAVVGVPVLAYGSIVVLALAMRKQQLIDAAATRRRSSATVPTVTQPAA